MKCWASILTLTFGTTWTAELLAPHFTLQEVPLYSFLLEDDSTPGLEKIRHKE